MEEERDSERGRCRLSPSHVSQAVREQGTVKPRPIVVGTLMPLDLDRLEHVRQLPGGKIIAQCPACMEEGHDRRCRNHLVIWPDGRFGCVAHPDDGQHRKRIYALAGKSEGRGEFRPGAWVVKGILRQLARPGRRTTC